MRDYLGDQVLNEAIRDGVDVNYVRPRNRCRKTWDPEGPEFKEDLSWTPHWTTRLADDRVVCVYREGGEVNGYVEDPDNSRRMAWDTGPTHTRRPLSRADHPPEDEQATDDELAFMNLVLRPVALQRTWEELVAEAQPCSHTDPHCDRTTVKEDAR